MPLVVVVVVVVVVVASVIHSVTIDCIVFMLGGSVLFSLELITKVVPKLL
jgi:hypothetical protein